MNSKQAVCSEICIGSGQQVDADSSCLGNHRLREMRIVVSRSPLFGTLTRLYIRAAYLKSTGLSAPGCEREISIFLV